MILVHARIKRATIAGLQKLHKNQNTRMERSQPDSDDDFSTREPKRLINIIQNLII